MFPHTCKNFTFMWTDPFWFCFLRLSGSPVYQQTWHHIREGREADTREIRHKSIWGALFWIAHLLWHRSNTLKTTFGYLCKWAPYTHGANMAFVYHAGNIQRTHSFFLLLFFFPPVHYHNLARHHMCCIKHSPYRGLWQFQGSKTSLPLMSEYFLKGMTEKAI